MKNTEFSIPEQLTDISRLPEIFKLRVTAYENSPGKDSINSSKYPDGFRDDLEERSIHFVSFNKAGEIIGAARTTILWSLDETPYPGIFIRYKELLPKSRPFIFYSKMAIHPDYRKMGLVELIDAQHAAHVRKAGNLFSLTTCKHKRFKSLSLSGYKIVAEIRANDDLRYPFSAFEQTYLVILTF